MKRDPALPSMTPDSSENSYLGSAQLPHEGQSLHQTHSPHALICASTHPKTRP